MQIRIEKRHSRKESALTQNLSSPAMFYGWCAGVGRAGLGNVRWSCFTTGDDCDGAANILIVLNCQEIFNLPDFRGVDRAFDPA
jgi:hypothetical protein